jgi:hypothetical protein
VSPASAGNPGGGTGDVVRDVERVIADAVALGYSVIGDNLAHGQQVATRLSRGGYRIADAGDDVTSAGQRMLRLVGDLGQVWIDLVGAVARDPSLHEALQRRTPRDHGAAGLRDWSFVADAGTNPKVHVHPYRLNMSSLPGHLACQGLTPQGGAGAAITGIQFMVSHHDRQVLAVIKVPPEQAPGHYVGAVTTVPGGMIVGTLSLEVKP